MGSRTNGPFTVLELAAENGFFHILEILGGQCEEGLGNPMHEDTAGVDIELSTIAIQPHIARAESFKKEYKARTKSKSKLKSKSTEKANLPPSTLVAATPPQNILGVLVSPPPLPPPPAPPPPPEEEYDSDFD
ncbi:hypothetical protein TrST_g13910 [Triparma strigata]|uniref:Uncharacterized protein n=1 Tax=Triparma strigata TaxID=1606541 RepID=A0A9W7BET6_9STRA|nr:hypothetical protein TrST_g13910 [Triparma strigata]